jgi:hypothetical protein
MKNIESGANVKENITISIKNTCCKRTKSINIHIDKDDTENINNIKEIMKKIENNIVNNTINKNNIALN